MLALVAGIHAEQLEGSVDGRVKLAMTRMQFARWSPRLMAC